MADREQLRPRRTAAQVARAASTGSWAFPFVVVLAVVALTAARVSGSSTGVLHRWLYGDDARAPGLLAGTPRGVRSDEWLVNTPLTIAQDTAGLPVRARDLAGGIDVSLVYDVPYLEASLLLKPHHWGFLVLPLEHAFALRWWLLPALLVLSGYALVLQALPGRHLFAAAVGSGLWLSAFTQWWHITATAPLAFATAAAAATPWLLDATTARQRVVRGTVLAWACAAFGVVLYPPFQVPLALVVLAFGTGQLLARRRLRPGPALRRSALTGIAAVVAALAATGAFVLTRADAVQALRDTVYPGDRVVAAGGFPLERLLYGSLTGSLTADATSATGTLAGVGGSQSEASAFLLLGLLLLPVQVFLLARGRRRGGVDPVLVGLLVAQGLLLAHTSVPGTDLLSRATLLTLVPPERAQIGLGLVSALLVVATVAEAVRQQARVPWPLVVATATAGVGLHALVWQRVDAASLRASGGVAVLLVGGALVAWLLVTAARGSLRLAACGLAALALWAGAGVNPLQQGLVDPRDTAVGQAVARASAAEPGATWVSTSGHLGNAVLVSSAVPTWSGVYSYPVPETWAELDPGGRYEPAWNRYAHRLFGEGLPGDAVQAFQADVVLVRLDPCDAFSQGQVDLVLAIAESTSPCLRLRERVVMPTETFLVYRVVAPPV